MYRVIIIKVKIKKKIVKISTDQKDIKFDMNIRKGMGYGLSVI